MTEEFEAYLGCGLLSRGCLHVRCEQCGNEMVVAFSCKGRFCPSCSGRRMTELPAQLVDRVIPDVPVRQWVLSLAWSLRYQLAFDAALCRDVLAVFIRLVFGWVRCRAGSEGLRDGQCGAITVIQRFGSSLNLNVHFHSLVLDGVFTRSRPTAAPVFHALPAPTDAEVAEVLDQVYRRVRRLLRRRGRWPEEEASANDPVAEQLPLLAGYAAASMQDPGDPQNVVGHFSAIVHTGPVEPRPERPKRTIRDFRHPEDLGAFFHSWYAPGFKLSEKKQKEIAKLLADLLIAEYRKTSERWARIPDLAGIDGAAPRCRAQVTSVEGRRVFMMTRPEWERFRAHEGKLVEIDLERSPAGSLGEAASAIASLTVESSVHTERIEMWRYQVKNPPTPENVHDYLVLENLSRRVNVPRFAERASTKDSPALRKHLREHVFVVKERPDKGRWEAKARTLERIVFLAL